MITRSLSFDAMLLEDAETDVKLLVKSLYIQGQSGAYIRQAVKNLIDEKLKQLKSRALVVDAYKSLMRLADRVLRRLQATFGLMGSVFAGMVALALRGRLSPVKGVSGGAAGIVALDYGVVEPIGKGLPIQVYSRRYMSQVNKAMSIIADEKGLDPNDVSGRNSLRNLAEMQTRFESHEQDLSKFRTSGVKLVVCSTHADCSDRCFGWQGRVYSLDGSSGITVDGRKYIPLETATDVYYTTKSGRTYKNGLLGFNCRHKLYEYRPNMHIPYVSKAVQEKENAINKKQRNYENKIRKFRELALFAEDPKIRKKARAKAAQLNKEYVAFSVKNKRAYYPDRVKILFDK